MADHPSYLALPDDTAWPNPDVLGRFGWRLRYGQPTREDLLFAASVLDAFQALVAMSSRRREETVRLIRAVAPPSGMERSDG